MRKIEQNKLRGLSVDELISFREAADGLIRERLHSEKQQLQEKLARIARYESGFKEGLLSSRPKSGRPKSVRQSRPKLAPKYKDPASGQTWAGRGLQPRWLRDAIASGKSQTDFLINGG